MRMLEKHKHEGIIFPINDTFEGLTLKKKVKWKKDDTHLYVASYPDFVAKNLGRGFSLLCDITVSPELWLLWLRQEQIFRYHRSECPIASTACPSQSILLRICEASTGKNNGYLKSLTSEANRREREKWVLVNWKQNPYQKIGLGLVKAKPISCTLDLLYTQIQDSLSWTRAI